MNREEYARRSAHRVGFVVERATDANFLLLPMVVAKRLAERWIPHVPPDLEATPGWLNGILIQVLRSEGKLLRFLSPPIGVSVLAMAQRPAEPYESPTLAPSGGHHFVKKGRMKKGTAVLLPDPITDVG